MKYKLPNGEVIDLGIYTIDDCEIFNEDEMSFTQKELSDLLFEKTGILVADVEEEEGGEFRIGQHYII